MKLSYFLKFRLLEFTQTILVYSNVNAAVLFAQTLKFSARTIANFSALGM